MDLDPASKVIPAAVRGRGRSNFRSTPCTARDDHPTLAAQGLDKNRLRFFDVPPCVNQRASLASGLQPCVGFAGYPIVDFGLRLKAVDMLNAAVRPREFDVPRTAIFQTARLHRWLG